MLATTVSLLALVVCAISSPAPLTFQSEASDLVQQLYDVTSATQVQKEVKWQELLHWHKVKGVYQSEVKLNFHGGPAYNQFRKLFKVFDNNMFATAWVTSNLLDAYKYGGAPRPSDEQVNIALEAIATHKDRNSPHTTSNMVFWSQVYNKTTAYWLTRPENLLHLLDSTDGLPTGFIEAFLKRLGLGELADEIEELLSSKALYKQAFRVPPDFDDTFVNIGLGSQLYELREDLKYPWANWQVTYPNISSATEALKQYAYRPFSNDRDINTIDPRTYYYLRDFLNDAKARGEDIALTTTWIENLSGTRKLYANGNPMPFNVNNVDITVAADVIFGLTSGITSGLIDAAVLDDPEIAQIYLNTSSLLAFEIANNLTSRPDLALTYYPSVIEYYWFVARIVNNMEEALKSSDKALPDLMKQVYGILVDACLKPMTNDILSRAKSSGVEQNYFDDFLGMADTGFFNGSANDYEDRIFTTAMAGNALLYTWTIFDDEAGANRWREGTPQNVKDMMSGIINWLSKNTLSGKYKPWNAFFSGSVKGFTALPFWYPGNRYEFLNGTAIKDKKTIPRGAAFFYGVEGYIPEAEYDTMLDQTHFGVPTPRVFNGYNAGQGYFPFWSSPSYTYSCVLLAVSRWENIVA